MTISSDLLKKLQINENTCVNRAVQAVREYLDSQPDPHKAANALIGKFGIQPVDNRKKAYVFAMTSIEQNLISTPKIESIISKANERISAITDMLGSGAFVDYTDINGKTASGDKKGSKRKLATELFNEHRDKGDKFVIALLEKELGITKQNAYTYVYLIKKNSDNS
jgi:hypothetical protein